MIEKIKEKVGKMSNSAKFALALWVFIGLVLVIVIPIAIVNDSISDSEPESSDRYVSCTNIFGTGNVVFPIYKKNGKLFVDDGGDDLSGPYDTNYQILTVYRNYYDECNIGYY